MSTEIPDLSQLKIGNRGKSLPKSIKTSELDATAPISEIPSFDNTELSMPIELPEPLIESKSPELIAKEQELRIIISLYKCKFPSELSILGSELDPISVNMMDVAQLESLRDKCDRLLGASSGCDNKVKMMNMCLYIIEKIGCIGGIQCEGLTGILLKDRDYQRDITRLALKYLSASDCKPEYTVPLKILSSCVQLHANNEIIQKEKAIQQQLSSNDAAKKLNDITEKFDNIA